MDQEPENSETPRSKLSICELTHLPLRELLRFKIELDLLPEAFDLLRLQCFLLSLSLPIDITFSDHSRLLLFIVPVGAEVLDLYF